MSLICPRCNTKNADNSNFCIKCSYKFPKNKHCVKCGAMLPLNSKFCTRCGTQSVSRNIQRVPTHEETAVVQNVRQARQPNQQNGSKPHRQQRVPTRVSQQSGSSNRGNKTFVLTFIIIACLAVIGGAIWLFFLIQNGNKLDAFINNFAKNASNNRIVALETVYPDIVNADSVAIPGLYGKPIIEESEIKGTYSVKLSPDVSIMVVATNNDKFQVTESWGLFAFSDKNLELLKKSADWSSTLDDVKRVEVLKRELDKRINFTSPDLDIFNLHGPVKELVVSYTGQRNEETTLSQILDNNTVYRFTEGGDWKHDFYQVQRNNNGYITEFYPDRDTYYNPEDNHWFIGQFRWNGSNLRNYEAYPLEMEFSYYDGKISEINVGWIQSMIMSDIIKLSNFQYDEYGNWISCNWKEKVIAEFYDSASEIKTYSGTLKRRIEYY